MTVQVAVDETLADEAMRLGKHMTLVEAANAALEECIRSCKRRGMLDLIGKVEYFEGHDYKSLRTRGTRHERREERDD